MLQTYYNIVPRGTYKDNDLYTEEKQSPESRLTTSSAPIFKRGQHSNTTERENNKLFSVGYFRRQTTAVEYTTTTSSPTTLDFTTLLTKAPENQNKYTANTGEFEMKEIKDAAGK